ncbi:MAG: outer membrane beta-barrel protein [Candidatus Omnitrophota bacterium]
MLKKTAVFILLAMSVTAFAYAAPERVGKHEIGVNVSGFLETDEDIDDTLFIGGQWAYGITDWFAIGASSGWAQADSQVAITGSGVTLTSDSEFTAVPIMADFIFRASKWHENLVPYAVVGVGVVLWDLDGTTTVSAPGVGTFPVQIEVDNAFGLKAGGGFDWFINENWILFFEATYTWTEPDVETTVLGTSSSDEVDLSYINVGGGVKFVF